MGIPVFFGSAAGLRFGEPLDIANNPSLLYAFAIKARRCILFLDELQSYINKYSQNATSHVAFTESLAGMRKNKVHVIYTAQADSHCSQPIRVNTGHALYPSQQKGYWWQHPANRRMKKWRSFPGKHDFCKLVVWEMYGNALSFLEEPSFLQRRMGWTIPKPKVRRWNAPYNEVFEASKLYNTLEQLDFGARWRAKSEDVKSAADEEAAVVSERNETRAERSAKNKARWRERSRSRKSEED